ncbi:hypothetical protein B0H14DRAFT_2606645 [Mycena olivaceomarginata]|nr:hypothetical protein B0H14DRAFT_2606645 [Mycena olivaceomarginata]
MFSKFMLLALYTVQFVQAMPFSFTSDVSCVSNNYEVRSPLYPGAKPLKLFNVGVNAAVFAAPAGEILCHRSDANPGDNGFTVPNGSPKEPPATSNRCQNALVACPNTNPVEFILESAAADVYKIRLAGQNLVWEGVYGGVNTQYDYVRPTLLSQRRTAPAFAREPGLVLHNIEGQGELVGMQFEIVQRLGLALLLLPFNVTAFMLDPIRAVRWLKHLQFSSNHSIFLLDGGNVFFTLLIPPVTIRAVRPLNLRFPERLEMQTPFCGVVNT